jgi:uncharacterized protein YdeI (YjbR/CyaY-like superfamily)
MSMVHTGAVFFEDDKAFETWLVENASTATHVWIRMAKKGTGVASINWTTAVDVALCFGWIDGIARRLTAEERMRPDGLAEVEKAKADGRWDAA